MNDVVVICNFNIKQFAVSTYKLVSKMLDTLLVMQLTAINASAAVATMIVLKRSNDIRWMLPMIVGLNILNCANVVRRLQA